MDPITPVFAKALRYLSYRSRSEKEIRDYLKKKMVNRHSGLSRIDSGVDTQVSPQNDEKFIIDAVIQKLKDIQLLDDAAFAKAWVRSRTEYRPRARNIIKLELRQKGISDDIIEEVLADKTEGKDDSTLAQQLLEKRKKRYEGMEKQERYQKAGGFLARKGFSYDVIKSAIDSVFRNGV